MDPRQRQNIQDFFNVRTARDDPIAQTQSAQNALGLLDRYTWARLQASESPYGALSQALMIPGDYLAKRFGVTSGRSEPDINSVLMGYKGLYKGLTDRNTPNGDLQGVWGF